MTTKRQGKLAEDFPHKFLLEEAGLDTYAKVRNLNGDYTDVPLIGAERGAEVDEALKRADDEAEKESGAGERETGSADDELPEDFPHRDLLEAVGLDTYAQVRALKGDYKTVPGIGDARAAEVNAALDAGKGRVGETVKTPTQILLAGTRFPFGGRTFTLAADAPVTFDGVGDEAVFAGALLVSGDDNFRLNVARLTRRYSPVHGGVVPFECDQCGKAVPDELALPQIDAEDNDAEKVYCSAECERKASEA